MKHLISHRPVHELAQPLLTDQHALGSLTSVLCQLLDESLFALLVVAPMMLRSGLPGGVGWRVVVWIHDSPVEGDLMWVHPLCSLVNNYVYLPSESRWAQVLVLSEFVDALLIEDGPASNSFEHWLLVSHSVDDYFGAF